jgi:hypothetical protein
MENENLIKCHCDTCGSYYNLFYNPDDDFYICFECLEKKESNEQN